MSKYLKPTEAELKRKAQRVLDVLEADTDDDSAQAYIDAYGEYRVASLPETILSLISALEAARQEAVVMRAVVEAAKTYRDSHWSIHTPSDTYERIDRSDEQSQNKRALFGTLKELEAAAGTGDAPAQPPLATDAGDE